MNVRRLATRAAAVVLPVALVLGATGTALAAKPVRPTPVLDTKPAASSNVVSPTFGWHVDTTKLAIGSAMSFSCALDGATAAACGGGTVDAAHSPVLGSKAYSNLTNRTHTFVVKAYAGTSTNGKASAASWSWRLDTVPPVAPLVNPIASPTSNPVAAVSFSDTDASVTGFTCALDGQAATPCTSPQSYGTVTPLSEGSHTVVVAARDAAGNIATGSVTWTVDHTAPNIPAVSGPPNPTNNPDAQITFTGEQGATYTCSLDGAVAQSCTSPVAIPALADGSHTFTVVETDTAANSSTGSATWVVDTQAPDAPLLVSSPASTTNDVDFTVRVGSTDPSTASFMCTFQGATAPCTDTWAPDALFVPVNGGYSLTVVAVDLAGNQSAPLSVSWTFDTAAPSPAEFVAGPGTPTNVANPVFDWVDTDISTASFDCSVDGSPRVVCQPGASLSSLLPQGAVVLDGTHALAVRALDATSNASSAVVWHWFLDRTGPSSQPHAAPGVPLNSGPVTSTPTFVFTTDDPNAVGFVCKLDGAATWTPCASGYTPPVGDGSHTLQVATVDQAGNPGTPITYTWTLDTHPPVGTWITPSTLAGSARVNFSEPVLGVTTSTVRMLVAGTSTVFPTTLSCRTAANAIVSCTSSQVRAAALSHTARLVPGQRYQLVAATAIHDPAGNALTAAVGKVLNPVYRAQRLLQENEPALSQAWASKASTSAYGGRYVQAHFANSLATYAYRGTAVTWYTATGPAMGTANVYCGNTLKAKVNNYATSNHWRVARTVKCSSTTANNLLRIVATGVKGSSAGKGTTVVVDAVKVGTKLTTNPTLAYRWGTSPSSLASGGRYAVADQSGEAFALTFRGTSITWRTLLGKNMGKAKVYVDGVYKGTFDQFATTTKAYNRTWKLTDKVHTIKVVVTGTRRTGATGTRVVLDALTVG